MEIRYSSKFHSNTQMEKMIKPAFSVIMMSYNYGEYIGAAINSVIKQSLSDWELIIVDDCSTDDSWRIIQSFKDWRIKAHRHEVNKGACVAYNQALSMARGRFIACLDADDMFAHTKLEQQANFFDRHPEVDICGTYIIEINKSSDVIEPQSVHADWFNVSVDLNDPSTWIWQNRLCHSGAVVRKEMHDVLGEFDNELMYTPDWQFWLRALVARARFAVLEEKLTFYRSHGENITHKNVARTVAEYAKTSVSIVMPWLHECGRNDLIDKLILGFIQHPEIISNLSLQDDIVRTFSDAHSAESFSSVFRTCIQMNKDKHDILNERDKALVELNKVQYSSVTIN